MDNPSLVVNGRAIPIVPNSISYTEGELPPACNTSSTLSLSLHISKASRRKVATWVRQSKVNPIPIEETLTYSDRVETRQWMVRDIQCYPSADRLEISGVIVK